MTRLHLAALLALVLGACAQAKFDGTTGRARGSKDAKPDPDGHLEEHDVQKQISLPEGTSEPLGAIPGVAGTGIAEVRSDDPKIATVAADGTITAVDQGSTVVHIVYEDGSTATIGVNVTDAGSKPQLGDSGDSSNAGNSGDSADNGGGGLGTDDDEVIDATIHLEDGEVSIHRKCKVLVTWTSNLGKPWYIPEIPDLPKGVEWVTKDLNKGKLVKADLDRVKLFALADGPVTSDYLTGYRTLTAAETDLLKARRAAGLNFVFGADNGISAPTNPGDASRGTRELLAQLTDTIVYNRLWDPKDDDRSGVKRPDEARFPFLQGVAFNFTAPGLNSPGDLSTVKSPAECVITSGGHCRVAWLAKQGSAGFIFVNGNAANGSRLYFAKLMAEACK